MFPTFRMHFIWPISSVVYSASATFLLSNFFSVFITAPAGLVTSRLHAFFKGAGECSHCALQFPGSLFQKAVMPISVINNFLFVLFSASIYASSLTCGALRSNHQELHELKCPEKLYLSKSGNPSPKNWLKFLTARDNSSCSSFDIFILCLLSKDIIATISFSLFTTGTHIQNAVFASLSR